MDYWLWLTSGNKELSQHTSHNLHEYCLLLAEKSKNDYR